MVITTPWSSRLSALRPPPPPETDTSRLVSLLFRAELFRVRRLGLLSIFGELTRERRAPGRLVS
jgi:hypothetical protein